MGFESEQVAVIDHYARHGDQYERRITAYSGRFAGLFNRNRGDGFHDGQNYSSHAPCDVSIMPD